MEWKPIYAANAINPFVFFLFHSFIFGQFKTVFPSNWIKFNLFSAYNTIYSRFNIHNWTEMMYYIFSKYIAGKGNLFNVIENKYWAASKSNAINIMRLCVAVCKLVLIPFLVFRFAFPMVKLKYLRDGKIIGFVISQFLCSNSFYLMGAHQFYLISLCLLMFFQYHIIKKEKRR